VFVSDGVKDQLIDLLSKAISEGVNRLCTGALLEREAGLLVVRRASTDDYLPGNYELPGGGMDDGENIIECLCREMREETSVVITHVDGIALSFDYMSKSGAKVRQLNFIVRGEGEIKLDPREHDEARFVTQPSDLTGLMMSSESMSVILGALGRR